MDNNYVYEHFQHLVDVRGTASPAQPAVWSLYLSFSAGPICPAPVITQGALVCHPAANGRQSCDLICHQGYQNSLPVSSFLCETASRRWDGDEPLSGACQSTSLQRRHVKNEP